MLLYDGHQYEVTIPTANQTSVTDSVGEVIGILTLDENTESASILAFYDDGSEDTLQISFYDVAYISPYERAEIVINNVYQG